MSNIMLGDALRELRGPLYDFFTKLESTDGQTVWWPAFKRFLRKENPWEAWRTIRLGDAFKSADDFRKALIAEGLCIGDWANVMMSQPDFSESLENADPDEEFELVVMTTKELLGEDRNGTTDEVFAGVKRLGLEECPAWMGPKLRLEYRNQAKGEWIFIGMKPIRYSDGFLDLFYVVCSVSGLWLGSLYGTPDSVWSPGLCWLFVRPRKCQKQNLDS